MNVSYSVKLGDATGSEPCTLSECKSQLKIDYTTDDTLITALITAARMLIEQYTGISLVEREINAVCKLDGCHLFELPYGPVDYTTLVIQQLAAYGGTNTTVTGYSLYGDHFVQIQPEEDAIYALTYNTGWVDPALPGALKEAVIQQVAYMYEHRGDENDDLGLSPNARMLAKVFRRVFL